MSVFSKRWEIPARIAWRQRSHIAVAACLVGAAVVAWAASGGRGESGAYTWAGLVWCPMLLVVFIAIFAHLQGGHARGEITRVRLLPGGMRQWGKSLVATFGPLIVISLVLWLIFLACFATAPSVLVGVAVLALGLLSVCAWAWVLAWAINSPSIGLGVMSVAATLAGVRAALPLPWLIANPWAVIEQIVRALFGEPVSLGLGQAVLVLGCHTIVGLCAAYLMWRRVGSTGGKPRRSRHSIAVMRGY